MEVTLTELAPGVPDAWGRNIIWGWADSGCSECGTPLLASAAATASPPLLLVCLMGHVTQTTLLSLNDQHALLDRLVNLKETGRFNEAAARVAEQLSTTRSTVLDPANLPRPKRGSKSAGSSSGKPTVDVPVPEGYRSVAWLRPHEAEVTLEAYRTQATVTRTTSDGALLARAEWYPPGSSESLLYRAEVRLVRGRGTGEKTVGWIREEEAEAVVEASLRRQDVEFVHRTVGRGGLVEYFAPGSPAAEKYRSPTRLLRRSR